MDVETFREHYRNLRYDQEQLDEAKSSWVMKELVRPALRSTKRRAKQNFKKGVKTLIRKGKRGVKALYNTMIREEVLNYLIDEGYALDVMEAEDLIQKLDEAIIEDILDEVTGCGRVDPDDKTRLANGESPSSRMSRKAREIRMTDKTDKGWERAGKIATKRIKVTGGVRNEDYNFIVNYLINEGYADNIDSAVSILESMSDEWVESIIDSVL